MYFKKYINIISLYIKKQLSREEGIRTLDTLLAYTHFPGVRLKPLGHLSVKNEFKNNISYYRENIFLALFVVTEAISSFGTLYSSESFSRT